MTDVLTRQIGAADIRKFMTGKRITGCAVCAHYDWSVKDDMTAIRCAGSAHDQPVSNVAIIMLVCQNCGAMQFHDRTVIARWLDCHSAT